MQTTHKAFVAAAGLLLAWGALMVYSASITSRPSEHETVYLSRQAAYLGVALTAAGLAALLPAAWWRHLSPALFAATTLLLVAVLIPGVGVTVNGARRWLRLGSVSLQPSELAKLALPLLLCRLAAGEEWRLAGRWRSTLVPLGALLLTVSLVIVEPDLGTAVFLTMTASLALFLSGWPVRRFVILGAPAIPALAGLVALKPYQWSRIKGFLATWQDLQAAPYQIRQSLTAVGTGGLWGTGLGGGQHKLSFLPEANTDFVFAVIGEELGLVGTLAVLLLWGALFGLGMRLLSSLPRGGFERAVGVTLLSGLVLQAAINMAVVLALVPPKGISLPLISYGGSNLLVSLLTVGIVLSLSRGADAPCPEGQRRSSPVPAPGPHGVRVSLSASQVDSRL